MSGSGSWWQLLDIYKFADQEFDWYASNPPFACPNDGEPLRQAPTADSGSDCQLYCPVDGWQYPRDYIRPERL